MAEEQIKNQNGSKKTNKWLVPVIVIVAVVVLAVAIVFGVRMMNGGAGVASLDDAKAACATASDENRVAANEYSALVNGDAAEAAALTEDDVTDAATLDALNKALAAEAPEYPGCVADDQAGYESATQQINELTGWYQDQLDTLQQAVDAVNAAKQ